MGDDILLEEQEVITSLNDLLNDYEDARDGESPWDLVGVKVEPPVKEASVIEGDILALVLYWNSINLTSPRSHDGTKFNYWCSILRSMLYSDDDYEMVLTEEHLKDIPVIPTKENYSKAAAILDYYKLKLSHRALMADIPFSEYENKLASFVNSPVGTFDLESIGVIVRLETTFDVDATLDGFMDKYTSLPATMLTTPFGESIWDEKKSSYETHTLKFVKKVNVLGNKENNIRYYFEKENELYCMRFGEKNSLLSVLDHVLETKDGILQLTCSLSSTIMYANSDFWYHTVNDGFTIE